LISRYHSITYQFPLVFSVYQRHYRTAEKLDKTALKALRVTLQPF